MGGEIGEKMEREVKSELLTEILTGFYELRKDIQDHFSTRKLDPDNIVTTLKYWERSGLRNRYYAYLGNRLSKFFGDIVEGNYDEMFQMSMNYINNARSFI